MFDTWTWQAKLLVPIAAAAVLFGLVFAAIQFTGTSAPTASVASPASAAPKAPTTPASPTASAPPSASTTLLRLHYRLMSESGSSSKWAPPVQGQPAVTLTATKAIAYFPGYSCSIPRHGETIAKGIFFGVGQLIQLGGVLIKPSELSSVTTTTTVTSGSVAVGYLRCSLT